jgi:hypothetical protein
MNDVKLRAMTKSPVKLAVTALRAAEAIPVYSSSRSRKDFTMRQHLAMASVRQFMKLDFRGFTELLGEFAELREALGLEKVPHYTTLQKAEQRLKKGTTTRC